MCVWRDAAVSIYDRRLEAEVNKIIRKNLANGYVPTANEVIGELSRFLADNNLSIPSYKYKKIGKDFTTSILSNAKQNVAQDMETLFGALIELYQLSEEQISKFTVEKKKYDYKLSKLESKLTSLVDQYSTDGYMFGYRNNFSDMEEIDLSKTTADIDIINYEATLKRLGDTPYKDFDVSVSAGDYIIVQSSPIESVITQEGIAWQGIVEKQTQEKTTLTVDIDTKEINKINRISLDMPMLKKCDIVIYTSIDGDKWNLEYIANIMSRCTANLSNKTRYIRIEISRSEADKYQLGKYYYYYIIQNVQLDSVNYALESDVVSNPINIGSNINKVSLTVESEMPPATSIDYFVAINGDDLSWIPISPTNSSNKTNSTMIAFNTIETDQRLSISIPQDISNNAYELKNYSVNGQRLFAIAELNDIDITNYRLYKGTNAWQVKTLSMTASGPQTHSVFISNPSYVDTKYIPIVEDKPSLVVGNEEFSQNKILNYSTNIYRETGDINLSEILASSHPVTVYLNGTMLYSGTPSGGTIINYLFKKGQNLLEVIVNVNNAPTACSVDLNLPLFSIGSMICANINPMTPVSLFDLRYNTNNQYDVYTVYSVGKKHTVIVKDPNLAIRYDFIYDYTADPVNEILVKATLRREHSSVDITPRLISYEVKFI
jgi:hypothetical protein